MKLTLITGYREYLLPSPLSTDELTRAADLIGVECFLPQFRWTDDHAYPTFVLEGAEDNDDDDDDDDDDAEDRAELEQDRRVALLIDYLRDSAAPDAHVMAVLPMESFGLPAARGAELSDPLARKVVAAAREALGESAVSWRRLALNDNTQAVLGALHARLGGPPENAALTQEVITEATSIINAELIDRDETEVATMQRNYGYAVLRLCGKLVNRQSVLSGRGRANIVARLLERDQLHVRTDLDPKSILLSAEPGGELFELLSRPLPSPKQ